MRLKTLAGFSGGECGLGYCASRVQALVVEASLREAGLCSSQLLSYRPITDHGDEIRGEQELRYFHQKRNEISQSSELIIEPTTRKPHIIKSYSPKTSNCFFQCSH